MTFRESFSMGQSVGDRGVAAYDRELSYKDKLAERAAAAAVAKDKAEEGDYRYDRTQEETERHNKAMETKPPGGGRGGAGMTPEQRKSIARGKIMSDYTRAQGLGLEISPDLQSSYEMALSDEYAYLHPGEAMPKAPAPSKPAPDSGWKETISNAIRSGRDFFGGSDVPAPVTAPPGWKPRKAKLANGSIVTETAPGVWPQ